MGTKTLRRAAASAGATLLVVGVILVLASPAGALLVGAPAFDEQAGAIQIPLVLSASESPLDRVILRFDCSFSGEFVEIVSEGAERESRWWYLTSANFARDAEADFQTSLGGYGYGYGYGAGVGYGYGAGYNGPYGYGFEDGLSLGADQPDNVVLTIVLNPEAFGRGETCTVQATAELGDFRTTSATSIVSDEFTPWP